MMSKGTFRRLRVRQFRREQRGVAAIEFAVGLLVLLLFIFGIINLGDLALTQYAMNHGVAAAARYAAIEASNGISANGPVTSSTTVVASECPTESEIQKSFDSNAAPPFTSQNPAPQVSVNWWGTMSPCGGTNLASPPPGGGVRVSVLYKWTPIAAGGLFGNPSVTLAATQSVAVMMAPGG